MSQFFPLGGQSIIFFVLYARSILSHGWVKIQTKVFLLGMEATDKEWNTSCAIITVTNDISRPGLSLLMLSIQASGSRFMEWTLQLTVLLVLSVGLYCGSQSVGRGHSRRCEGMRGERISVIAGITVGTECQGQESWSWSLLKKNCLPKGGEKPFNPEP